MQTLTDNHVEVLLMIAEGYSTIEMAQRLGVTRGRLKSITYEIRKRLGATNNSHAIALAYHHGILIPKIRTNGTRLQTRA